VDWKIWDWAVLAEQMIQEFLGRTAAFPRHSQLVVLKDWRAEMRESVHYNTFTLSHALYLSNYNLQEHLPFLHNQTQTYKSSTNKKKVFKLQ
jgi:hypothetical protein